MAETLPGLLLLHADAKSVDGWIRQGVVPAYVLPQSGWTAVVPAGPAQAKDPYRDGIAVLASRPLPSRMRPALGFFVTDGRAVVVVHPRGWRAITRYVVWEPSRGAVRAPHLPPARPDDLVRAAGVVPEAVGEVRSLLRSREGDPVELLDDLVRVLALPGEGLIGGRGVKSDPEAVLVEPRRSAVERFERVVAEDDEVSAELREHS
ncbi:hypothetical protein G9U51_16715 [Calidifontibacter sp. DB0510]|uniref:Uncharacterized protein n=1 Tax=Metallococcus carri TaxID=1656884 RepID=A0A967B229_9MICO|nr:hypothetical protein [Metallococcus carri]NHN57411.1 hypothetical protein [Metallococcus carri]NOP39193.1 hypothetical protein [Calidifontibacter sp. DB2511S]